MSSAPKIVRVELSFRSTEDAEAVGDRIRESVATIVGRQALEEFRVKTLPLGESPAPNPFSG